MEDENLLNDSTEINRLLDDSDDNISVYSNAPTIPDDHKSDSVEDIAENELRPDELEFTEGERHPDFVNIDFEDDSDLDPDYDPRSSQRYDDEVESTDSEVASERVRCVRIERGRGRGRRPAVNIMQPTDNTNYFYGKNRMKWAKTPPAQSRTRSDNIITKLPGLKGNAKITKPKAPVAAWKLRFDDNITESIISHTNERITNISTKYGDNALNCQFTQLTEKNRI
ncbi:hypothetical protein J6590_040226 [Homalodisca vitripennis]|nr:hypothetical protein J6590_040226 [Homalodisca vitripennis]